MTQKKPNIYSFESILHTLIHFIAIAIMFWVLSVPPLWVSFLAIIIWQLQFKVLGRCFLTIFAHKRNIMIGMTYWEYVALLFKAKHPKKVGHTIDSFLKLTIGALLVTRLLIFLKVIV